MGNIGMMFIPTDLSDDVLKAAEEDLGFTTKYFTLKELAISGFTTSVIVSGSASDYEEIVFTHNLGKRAAYEFYFEDHDGAMISIPGRSDDLADPSCGIIQAQTDNSVTIRVGYFGGATHPHPHDRKVLAVFYIETEVT